MAQNVNSSRLHPHPNRVASSLSSIIISSSCHTWNITSVNHFLPHTNSTSSPFSSSNRLVATTECFGDGLRVCCFNANSLLGHIETIRLFLASRPYYHIIAITETKVTVQQEDHLVSLGHYVLIRKDRNRQGGGVALFIHKSLTSKFLCASTEEWTCQPGTPEYIVCEVKGKCIPPLFAAVVYRPPHAPFIEKRNFIGYIYGVRRDEHITQYRRQLGWTTHVDRTFYFVATMFYKINQSSQYNYLANFFLRRVSNRSIRGEVKPLIIPKHDGEALQKSFHITTAYIWNSLSANIRNCPTIASFKTSLYNFIFNLKATSSFHQHVLTFQEAF